MKLFKSSKVHAPKSMRASMALAVVLCLQSGAAQAIVPVTDFGAVGAEVAHTLETVWNGVVATAHKIDGALHLSNAIDHLKHVKQVYDEAQEKMHKAESKLAAFEAKLESRVIKTPDADLIKKEEIDKIFKEASTEVSDKAKEWVGSAAVCKPFAPSQSAKDAATNFAINTVKKWVSDKTTARMQLQFNCVAQRELEALALRENYNYFTLMEDNLNKSRKKDEDAPNCAGDLECLNAHAANMATIARVVKAENDRHEAIKGLIEVRQQSLKRQQRDLEVALLQGVGGTGTSDLLNGVRAEVKNQIVKELVTGKQAVDGARLVGGNGALLSVYDNL